MTGTEHRQPLPLDGLEEIQRLRHKVLLQANTIADQREKEKASARAATELAEELRLQCDRVQAKLDAALRALGEAESRYEAELIRSRGLQSKLDAALLGIGDVESKMASEVQRTKDLLSALAAASETREIYQRQVEGFLKSRSWRITRPLREATAWVRRTPIALKVARLAIALLRRFRVALDQLVADRLKTGGPVSKKEVPPPPPPAPPPSPPTDGGVETASRLPEERALANLLARITAHTSSAGALSHVFALPFLANGGAEQTLAMICRKLTSLCPGRSQVLFLTDLQFPATPAELPSNVLVIDLLTLLPSSSIEQRKHFLAAVLKLIRPGVFHCVNSDIGWRTITEHGTALRHMTRLVGSIFAFQFSAASGERIGYAQTYLPGAYPNLHLLVSDNERFIRDAIALYHLDDHDNKCRVVRGVPRNYSKELIKSTRDRLTNQVGHPERRQERLKVLWAGRLDEEKRVDLLPKIAASCPGMDFEIFGKPVVGERLELDDVPNLHFRGPFLSPEDVFQDDFDAFIFTSRWEGLPNILLEVGLHGVPCVAPTVGGVGELISEQTGYPLAERAEAADYQRALALIERDPTDAAARAARLLEHIEVRHSPEQFEQALLSLPGYLSPNMSH